MKRPPMLYLITYICVYTCNDNQNKKAINMKVGAQEGVGGRGLRRD